MIYDANGRAVKRSVGYLRQWTPCDGGGYTDAVGSRIIDTDEPEPFEECMNTNLTRTAVSDGNLNSKPCHCEQCSAPKSDKAKKKVKKVMSEYASGDLKSSSGATVTKRPQAIAIALSEARRAKK